MGWKELSSVKRTAITLTAVLLVTGVVLATGNFLGSTSVNQVIDTVLVTVLPTPSSDWDNVVQGSPWPFSVTVTNPTTVAIGDIHLELTLACSGGLNSAVITGQLVPADVGNNLCSGSVHSFSKVLGASTFETWTFSVTYNPPGDAAWTFEAQLVTSP